MTRIDKRKTRLTFEATDAVRERGKLREVVFEVENGWIINVRLKGLRSKFPISPAAIFNHAVKIHVEKARAERKARKGKK